MKDATTTLMQSNIFFVQCENAPTIYQGFSQCQNLETWYLL